MDFIVDFEDDEVKELQAVIAELIEACQPFAVEKPLRTVLHAITREDLLRLRTAVARAKGEA
jgi:hypothetical protein